jgi:hypothetical protein
MIDIPGCSERTNFKSKEIDDDSSNRNHTDNLSQQSYDNNSIINSISNGDI